MAPATQAKVLRVLQERRFERLGGTTPVEVDVRVVAATHRNLEAEIAAGRFREDLYYRLRVVEVALPPLRERREDLPALAQRILAQVAERHGRAPRALTPAALATLGRHAWPGNVRELRNALERAAVMCEGDAIDAQDLQLDAAASAPPDDPSLSFSESKRRATEEFERAYLLRALRAHGGNISRTADAIGMVRQSLQQKMRELGLREALASDDDSAAPEREP
jgi:DNA-binding NtrC family response regulator